MAPLPSSSDAVAIKSQLIADDGQVLCLRLSDQHPIKWISLRPRKQTRSNAMLRAYWKALESGLRQIFLEIPGDIGGGREPSQTNLGRHFPRRRSADNDCVPLIEHQAANGFRERGTVIHPPDQSMRIK